MFYYGGNVGLPPTKDMILSWVLTKAALEQVYSFQNEYLYAYLEFKQMPLNLGQELLIP